MIINYNSEPQGIWTFFSITSSIFLRINFHTGRIWPKPQSGRISVVLTKRVVKFGNIAFNEHILMNFKEITLSRSIQLRFLQSPNEIKTSLIQQSASKWSLLSLSVDCIFFFFSRKRTASKISRRTQSLCQTRSSQKHCRVCIPALIWWRTFQGTHFRLHRKSAQKSHTTSGVRLCMCVYSVISVTSDCLLPDGL